MEIKKQLLIYFIIPGLFLSGFFLTSFSELTSDGPKEIIIEIEPPKDDFENNPKAEQEKQPEPEKQQRFQQQKKK